VNVRRSTVGLRLWRANGKSLDQKPMKLTGRWWTVSLRLHIISFCSGISETGAEMDAVPVWFQRKFEFVFPVEVHPNLCTRLRGTPARLEEMVRFAPRELLIRKSPEKWSAQEHAGHLLDVEPLWMVRVDDYLTGASELTVADLKNRKTHEANHNARPVEQILMEFRRERSRLVSRLENVDAALFSRTMLHPRLRQPMRLVDHMYFVAEHDDHHLARIWEMISGRVHTGVPPC
jgi:uncharacterized damage-inducible protein DinB